MLTIEVPPFEIFDETNNTFIRKDTSTILKMENSLIAISFWEQKYKKPYFNKKKINPNAKPDQRTVEETIYFMKCMIQKVNGIAIEDPEDIDDTIFVGMDQDNYKKITDYLKDTRTATVISSSSNNNSKNNRTLTSEVFYAWMSELQINWEAQYWNINRLINTIEIINDDNTPPDKKKKKKAWEQAQEWSRINEQRLKQMGTKG